MSLLTSFRVLNALKSNIQVSIHRRDLFKRTKKYRELCPNKTCEATKPKKSIWDLIRRKPKKTPCRMEQDDPNIELVGTIYQTCGPAYVVETDHLPNAPLQHRCPEDITLKGIEANLDHKHDYQDPLPQFTTVVQRVFDLNDKKLHPFYKMHQSTGSKFLLDLPFKIVDNVRTDYMDVENLPVVLKLNRCAFDAKNINFVYKRIEPPDQTTKRLIALRSKKKKTIEEPLDEHEVDSPMSRPQRTYDTLHQDCLKF